MLVEFEESTHTYKIDNIVVPSVTQIISFGDDTYKDIPTHILEQAGVRGTAIHKATELIDEDTPYNVPNKWLGYIKAYEQYLADYYPQWTHTEQILGSDKYMFAGTVDRLTADSIADIKTSRDRHDDNWRLQLEGYSLLAKENGLGDIRQGNIIWLKKDGSYELVSYELDVNNFINKVKERSKQMSKMICVMGESGSGKTTSMRNLDPKTTYYIDADNKGLSWKGWKNKYSKENKNLFQSRDLKDIEKCLRHISENRQDIKLIIIDTLNTCMLEHEVSEMKTGGFGKWVDLTQYVWEVCRTAGKLREDLTVIIVMHSETIRDDLGYSFTRIKTNGRKLEKVVLESLFGTVLLAKKNDTGDFVFETQANNSTAKTPLDAFETIEIPNDMAEVLKVLDEY